MTTMTGMLGADVAQLRSLAQQFDRAADRLDASRAAVGGAVESAHWRGADADRFRQLWSGQSAPRIGQVVHALRDAATSLRTNAQQQEQASAVDGGASSASAPGSAPSMGDVFSWLQDGLDWKPLQGVPVFGSFDVGFVMSKIPLVGDVTAAIGLGDVLYDPNSTGADRAWAATGFGISAAADALKSTGVGYLPGVAVAQVWDVVDKAAHTDWSAPTAENNWNYIVAHPGDAAVAASQAIVDYLPDLFDNLK